MVWPGLLQTSGTGALHGHVLQPLPAACSLLEHRTSQSASSCCCAVKSAWVSGVCRAGAQYTAGAPPLSAALPPAHKNACSLRLRDRRFA